MAAPPTGPPTKLPSNPKFPGNRFNKAEPPSAPRVAPATALFLLFFKRFCIFWEIRPPARCLFPSLSVYSSPNNQFWNFSDLLANPTADPRAAPTNGPPTKLPSKDPPIAPNVAPPMIPPFTALDTSSSEIFPTESSNHILKLLFTSFPFSSVLVPKKLLAQPSVRLMKVSCTYFKVDPIIPRLSLTATFFFVIFPVFGSFTSCS